MAGIDRSLVRALPLFNKLSDAELDRLLARATMRRVAMGEAVFEQGQKADRFFLLLHGRLKVTQVTADGQQIIVRMVHPGDIFGFAKALQRDDYPGTPTAAAESVVICWPTEVWGLFVEQNPHLAVNAMQTIGQRLQEAHTRIREMATEEVERRVAHAVLRLIEQAGKTESAGIRIDFQISRQDIAEMTGTTLHTVSRILSAWEAKGLVEGGRQKLLVRDAAGLRILAEGEAD
ncbi:Crp/Fnr family transcriptional regulator [Devosia sp.]|uniref:Crp/Fnr family transcriptional regulator n=1 Tax=Devosia sp. TaxID=1871048 RepID=UPI002FC6AA21